MGLTDQQAFDKVVNHLRNMEERSMDLDREKCSYRGAHGECCAVGILIPDEEYGEELEGKSVRILHLKRILPRSLWGLNLEMLGSMQAVHDLGGSWIEDSQGNRGYMEDQFQDLAETYNLKYTPPVPKTP